MWLVEDEEPSQHTFAISLALDRPLTEDFVDVAPARRSFTGVVRSPIVLTWLY
jgi:hypothetical protein